MIEDSYAYLSLREVCSRLHVSPATVYRWLKAGRLQAVREGRVWRFLPSASLARLAESTTARPPKFSVGDLFAGAGGLTLGFHLAGFNSVFFNEIDAEAALTYGQAFPSVRPFIRPIQDLTAKDVFLETGLAPGELDVLLGGPPCQGFSINAPLRSDQDARNHLFRHYVRLVLEGLRPKFIVFENVPGLVSHQGGQALRDVCKAFRSAGYEPAFRILNACHYGVPQERWRLLIVANRLGMRFEFPSPSHYSLARPNFTGGATLTFRYAARPPGSEPLFADANLQHPIPVESAIGDLPSIPNAGGADLMDYSVRPSSPFQRWARAGAEHLFNHHCVGISEINRARMRYVRPGGSWRDIPHDLLPAGMQQARRSDHTRRYGRLNPSGVAGTMMTKCDPHWGTVVHYNQDRVISVREAARFQSFPDTFRLYGSRAAQYRQVGNAVPPVLSGALATHIRHLLLAEQIDGVGQSRKRRSEATTAAGSRRS